MSPPPRNHYCKLFLLNLVSTACYTALLTRGFFNVEGAIITIKNIINAADGSFCGLF
jgi:hypothetical protein